MTRRPIRRTAAVAALGLLTATCGLGQNSTPRDLASDDVPFDLLAPRTTTSTTTTAPPARSVEVTVHLVSTDGLLVPVVRTLPAPTSVLDRIKVLLDGASDDEANRGLRTALQSGIELIAAEIDNGTVVLNFTKELALIQGEDGITAIAQVVFTATEAEGITGVRFELAGSPIEAPRGDGTLTSGPLTRFSFPNRTPDDGSAGTSTTSAAP